jgi:hypothetical protein
MNTLTGKTLVKAIAELVSEDWTKQATVMKGSDSHNLFAYGLLFTKDGQKFYLNKDTYVADRHTGKVTAEWCKPLFN